MTYLEFVDAAAEQIDSLAPRSKGALYWLVGSALLTGLKPPEEWADWFASARRVGYRFVTTGQVDGQAADVWGQASRPSGPDSSQLLSSAIVCLSTPVGISLDPGLAAGAWVEHALFPAMQVVSLELFGDVAFPDDDDDIDTVFAQPQVQLAVEYCQRTTVSLAGIAAPDGPMVDALLEGTEVLAPPAAPSL